MSNCSVCNKQFAASQICHVFAVTKQKIAWSAAWQCTFFVAMVYFWSSRLQAAGHCCCVCWLLSKVWCCVNEPLWVQCQMLLYWPYPGHQTMLHCVCSIRGTSLYSSMILKKNKKKSFKWLQFERRYQIALTLCLFNYLVLFF